MAAPVRPLITDLPKGHGFAPARVMITREAIERYLAAVDDSNTVYLETGLAPPVAVAALALTRLLEMIALPDGTLHIGQEIEAHGGLPLDAELSMAGRIAQRSVRAGAVISVIEFSLSLVGSKEPSLTGRTTAMVQGGAA